MLPGRAFYFFVLKTIFRGLVAPITINRVGFGYYWFIIAVKSFKKKNRKSIVRYSSSQLILTAACITFFNLGIYTAGVGPVLVELAEQTGSTLAAVGIIFSAIYGGSLSAQIVAAWFTAKFGRIAVMNTSIFMMAIGIFGFINSRSLFGVVLFCLFAGLGQGGVDIVSNLIVTDAYPKHNLAVLNLLHISYGIGSSAGPALIGLSINRFNRGIIVEWGAAVLFIFLGVLFLFIRTKPSEVTVNEFPSTLDTQLQKPLQSESALWILSLMILLVVGVQLGLGSWTTVYMTNTVGVTLEVASLITSAYWLFIVMGRIVAIILSKKINQTTLLLYNLCGSLLGAVTYSLSSHYRVPSIISLLFMAFSFGSTYPLMISIVTTRFKANADKACSIIVAAGTVGGLVIPWLIGNVLENVSPVAYTLFFVFCIAFLIILRRVFQRQGGFQIPKQ